MFGVYGFSCLILGSFAMKPIIMKDFSSINWTSSTLVGYLPSLKYWALSETCHEFGNLNWAKNNCHESSSEISCYICMSDRRIWDKHECSKTLQNYNWSINSNRRDANFFTKTENQGLDCDAPFIWKEDEKFIPGNIFSSIKYKLSNLLAKPRILRIVEFKPWIKYQNKFP